MSTNAVLAIAGIPRSTLDYWIHAGLVRPSILPGEGQRYERFWSPQDLVLVRIIRALREAGCPLQRVARAQKTLDEIWGTDLAGVVLYWDGREIMAQKWDEIYSLISQPGQQALHIVAASVAVWKSEAEAAADPIDLDTIVAHRRRLP